ncbi:MAG: glycosyltransferase family 39 protein [Polyangiaceae bacterium]|nr:glycosyltransferase family 39 protein [Polyangiaceae bacterium]
MGAATLKSYRTLPWDLIVICGLAAIFRFWDLGGRPPHFDEGINGNFVDSIWRNGFYPYDPKNFHGPLFFYLLQMAEMLLGRSVEAYRTVTVLLSLATIVLVYRYKRWIGPSVRWPAMILAVSPAFTFYARDAIHETLFVFGQVTLSYGLLHQLSGKRREGWIAMTMGAVILAATKETFVVFMGTLAIALGMVKAMPGRFLMPKLSSPIEIGEEVETITLAERLLLVGAGLFTLAALFTGYFQSWRGIVDFFRAFALWSHTGVTASGHSKPMTYWLKLMLHYEWWALLGLLLSLALSFWPTARVGRLARLIGLLAFGTFAAYSLIGYKTPWLILNMLWPIALSVGFFAHAFPTFLPKIGQLLLALAIFGHAGFTSYRVCFVRYESEAEPYVYVHTTDECKKVIAVLEKTRKRQPEILTFPIAILHRDSWPLPWVLGRYTKPAFVKVASWQPTEEPMLLLFDAKDRSEVERSIKGQWYVLPFKLRHSYVPGFAYFRADVFAGSFPKDAMTVRGGGP